ncbi:PrgI family protein [Candidatus Saccharibacteria bacterium]|nr:PrgI family protein [Candidatus Saccharibacteria bacterium]
MAVYKVPQDVEADDKLIGPFSFRQFIYLIIVVVSLAIGYFLKGLFLPLMILPLPVILFFGALALPLRKDQPMETYLAAIVSYYLKPHRRLWSPDGSEDLVEITAPKIIEVRRTKDLSETEAEKRLSYLANIVDTRGWAVRGVGAQAPVTNSAMNSDVYFEAQQTQDVLDSSGDVGRSMGARLDETNAKYHQQVLARVHQQVSASTETPPVQPQPDPQAPLNDPQAPAATAPAPATDQRLSLNPYPTMHQSVVQPAATATQQAAPATPPTTNKNTSAKEVSPDIIKLANNTDLSVETIAREANRIHKKQESSDQEVVISLR